ncbi:hypothetical protein KY385_01325 [Candidatus Parcubacteria bacterium]|nr:hypothetical protein [Candidatus Parcubacteria bacterium]
MIGFIKILAQGRQLKPKNCGEGQSDAFNPGRNPECLTNLPGVSANTSNLQLGLSIVFGVAASIALVSLVIAALNYATAATDHEKIIRSRKNIIFSLIGLAIALSAEVMVLTVLDNI